MYTQCSFIYLFLYIKKLCRQWDFCLFFGSVYTNLCFELADSIPEPPTLSTDFTH